MHISANNAAQCSSGRVMLHVRSALLAWPRPILLSIATLILLSGCGITPAPKSEEPVVSKPAEPAIPADIQSAADATLGAEAKVLVYGDLAKNGRQQVLVANVVPKTPGTTSPEPSSPGR